MRVRMWHQSGKRTCCTCSCAALRFGSGQWARWEARAHVLLVHAWPQVVLADGLLAHKRLERDDERHEHHRHLLAVLLR
eukprot:722522-Prymnesium_polylepis.3